NPSSNAVAIVNDDDDDDDDDDGDDDGGVLGYSYVVPFRAERPAYNPTVETSLFLAPAATGSGLGTQLLHQTLQSLTQLNKTLRLHRLHRLHKSEEEQPAPDTEYIEGEIQHIVALVAMEQTEDVGQGTRAARFWRREGFKEVGVMGGVGRKFGRWVDVGGFQREMLVGVGGGVGEEEGERGFAGG
ncbi:MAG: hypothetical protein L6R37_002698, partial [Teloschistes peruensis]